MSRLHAIPVTAGNRREVLAAIDKARQELIDGHVVCIFVEGAVSRTGNMLPFQRGFERIVAGLDVPIIPVYLDRVWGSVFSFEGGRFFWKLPRRLPYPVTVAFGAPLPSTTKALDARQALMELGSEAMAHRRPPAELLHTEFMKVAKRRWRHLSMADSTGQKLTFGRALVGSMLLGDVIRRRTQGQDMVGLLLPASVGGAIANIATLMAGRVPVNLNFTLGTEAMAAAVAEANIRTIVTSKRFLSKAGLAEQPGMVYLEDLRAEIGGAAKLRALLAARLLPVRLLRRWHGGHVPATSAATIIFSSGSTGQPKGIVLTHANILANVDSLDQIFPMEPGDCFIGVLPFFHSFGFTGTLWFPLLQSCKVAYHPNPMDAKTVGELAETYSANMLISTPTFCNAIYDAARRSSSHTSSTPSSAPRSSASRWPGLSKRSTACHSSKATARRRCHRWSRSTGRMWIWDETRKSAPSSDRWAIPFRVCRSRSSIKTPARARSSIVPA
jgi:acyl-[acyl-carrier-protein]-phospholipid O-acyltransferase/long-chain-fatty-acid--[acyl-carrier-protein] ligase